MTASKKRKLADAAPDVSSQTKAQTVRKRRRIVNRPKTTQNLFMKLPGELRNQVYDLALVRGESITIRPFRSMPHGSTLIRRTRSRWKEPGILKASKQIRKEVMPLYYLGNRFQVIAKCTEIEQARSWLETKSEQCGEPLNRNSERYNPFSEARIHFNLHIKSYTWKDMIEWVPLATWAFETDLEPTAVYLTNPHSLLLVSIQEVVNLGVRARERETPHEWLKEDFVDWAVAKIPVARHKVGWGRLGDIFTALSLLEEKFDMAARITQQYQ